MNIKEQRTKKGFTQMQMAVKMGVSITAYINWEKGGTNPTPENLKKLIAILGDE